MDRKLLAALLRQHVLSNTHRSPIGALTVCASVVKCAAGNTLVGGPAKN